MHRFKPIPFGFILMIATVLGTTFSVRGEEFRVVNRVFVGDKTEPVLESTTIFIDNSVYDYLDNPTEVIVFDKARGRFVLLDVTRRVRSELTTEATLALTSRVKKWSSEQSDPFVKFLADPKLEESFGDSKDELKLSSPWITYRVSTIEMESETMLEQYREFTDWYCRLNTLLNPGARPPFARLKLNEALQRLERFPRVVHLTLRPKEGFLSKRITLRSEHQWTRRLTESDRDRVAQTDQFMAIFQTVEFSDYQKEIEK